MRDAFIAALTLNLFHKYCDRILAGKNINAHNTFKQPNQVEPKEFKGAKIEKDGTLHIQMPAQSIAILEVK